VVVSELRWLGSDRHAVKLKRNRLEFSEIPVAALAGGLAVTARPDASGGFGCLFTIEGYKPGLLRRVITCRFLDFCFYDALFRFKTRLPELKQFVVRQDAAVDF
jgi:hypothetical protein